MSQLEILSEFKTQLVVFLDELVAQFPTEGDLIVVRLFLANQLPIVDAMHIFNYEINKEDQYLRKMVRKRDEAFFLHHNVFDRLGKTKVDHFKRLWRSGLLDTDDKKVIWSWVDTFIFLGDKYSQSVQST